MQIRLGQGVIVENRPGAGTTLGTKAVAVAEPDGYTLLVGSTNHFIAPVFLSDLGYDPVKSFVPVGMVTSWSHLLVVRPTLPVKTVGELIAYAKAEPGKVTFGFGTGPPPQILGEYLKVVSGADIISVPYRGSLQAITDMLGDRIDMHFSPVATLLPLIQQGKLRPLAYTGVKRVAGVARRCRRWSEADFRRWLSIPIRLGSASLAPAGTPPAVVATLHDAINESLKSAELQASFAKMGFGVQMQSIEQFRGKFLDAEAVKWPPIVKAAGIKSFLTTQRRVAVRRHAQALACPAAPLFNTSYESPEPANIGMNHDCDLYFWTTPNGNKMTIFLEEAGLPYTIIPINIGKGEQFGAEFLARSLRTTRSPRWSIAIRRAAARRSRCLNRARCSFYLAEKTGKFLSKDLRAPHRCDAVAVLADGRSRSDVGTKQPLPFVRAWGRFPTRWIATTRRSIGCMA